jgi:hypothetical protein
MPLTQVKSISGNMVIDGTIEANHIKANTITADRFSGAVEEEYWAYTDGVTVSFAYSGYTNVHTFNFPATELDIFKGRHVTYMGEAYMNTGTSTQYTGNLFLRLEVEVPTAQTSTFIGYATHQSSGSGSYQVVAFDGNIASNRIGSGGSIGTQGGNFRTYKNLYYDPKTLQGSDLITNGNFNTGVANWTLGDGSHSSGYGQYSLNTTNSTTFDPFSYQALTTVVGEKYQVTANITDGTANGEVRITTATNLDSGSQVATSGVYTGTATVDFEFTATSTTTYVMLVGDGTAGNQYVGFDNIVVKQYIPKTYVLLSTTGGQIVPSDGTPTQLWYHPYGGASAGTYALVDTHTQSTITRPYSNYFRFNTEAYIGWFNADLKMRLTCLNQIAFGKTVTLNDVKFFMQSRIVE